MHVGYVPEVLYNKASGFAHKVTSCSTCNTARNVYIGAEEAEEGGSLTGCP